MCPKYRRFWVPNSVVFLTLVTVNRTPVFGARETVEAALEVLRRVKAIHAFRMRGYVILPDHCHLLLWTEDGRFDRVMHSFKRNTVLALKEAGGREETIWQKRFYDHVIRDDADLTSHLDYVHYNPVHHGWTQKPADYEFSSFRSHVARGWYPKDWGSTAPRSIEGMNLE